MPTPPVSPAMPPSGWYKFSAGIPTDPVFLRVNDEHRLASVGLWAAAVGWTLIHDSEDGWVPDAALVYGQACAAPSDQIRAVIEQLVAAGLFSPETRDGLAGYRVGGAEKAISERFARKESASAAGKKSQEAQADKRSQMRVDRFGRKHFDPDVPVDWSQVSGEL